MCWSGQPALGAKRKGGIGDPPHFREDSMKRRVFIKGIMAATVSLFMPGRSPETKVNDQFREEFAKRNVLYPEAVGSGRAIALRSELNHLHDSLRYSLLDERFDDKAYLSGSRWPKEVQRTLNMRASKVVDMMGRHEINKLKK